MKKAVLFDADGTLLDSWKFVFDAVKHTSKTHKLSYPTDEAVRKALGKSLLEFYQVLYPQEDSQILGATHHEYQTGIFETVKLFPKAKQTLRKIKSLGHLTAVVSNRTRDSLLTSLEQAQISELFDLVVSAEDVKNPKPHPEHIQAVLTYLKVKPVNAFMVGDTDHDILAGKNAKVKTIGVTYGFFGESIKETNPDFVIDNLEELIPLLYLSKTTDVK